MTNLGGDHCEAMISSRGRFSLSSPAGTTIDATIATTPKTTPTSAAFTLVTHLVAHELLRADIQRLDADPDLVGVAGFEPAASSSRSNHGGYALVWA